MSFSILKCNFGSTNADVIVIYKVIIRLHIRQVELQAGRPDVEPLLQTWPNSSANMNSVIMAQILEQFTVLCERNAAEQHSRAPGPRLAVVLVFRGHGDVKFVATF